MATKTYGQMCPMARSMDVLGERWTVLVVRELLLGPKRFKHLMAALPAVGANRLSERLRGLEDAGVVHKMTLPPPSAVAAYELTPHGERLREPLIALGLWGLDLPLDERIDPTTMRADLIALSLTATQTEPLDPARHEHLQLQVDDETLHFELAAGRFLARSGPSPVAPVLDVACSLEAFMSLALRQLSSTQAVEEGEVTVLAGDPGLFTELFDTLVYEPQPD